MGLNHRYMGISRASWPIRRSPRLILKTDFLPDIRPHNQTCPPSASTNMCVCNHHICCTTYSACLDTFIVSLLVSTTSVSDMHQFIQSSLNSSCNITPETCIKNLCNWRDSNPYEFLHLVLSQACLPISPQLHHILSNMSKTVSKTYKLNIVTCSSKFKHPLKYFFYVSFCTPRRIQTCDLRIRNPLLYPLSYWGMVCI